MKLNEEISDQMSIYKMQIKSLNLTSFLCTFANFFIVLSIFKCLKEQVIKFFRMKLELILAIFEYLNQPFGVAFSSLVPTV